MDEDIAEFVRRLTFNSLIGNADMHLKNWSVIYPDKRNAALDAVHRVREQRERVVRRASPRCTASAKC